MEYIKNKSKQYNNYYELTPLISNGDLDNN